MTTPEEQRKHYVDLAAQHGVPEQNRTGLAWWIVDGLQPGGFLTAVLENNLSQAFARADPINRAAMFQIVSFLYNEAPGPCWGSPEKVRAWYEQFDRVPQ